MADETAQQKTETPVENKVWMKYWVMVVMYI